MNKTAKMAAILALVVVALVGVRVLISVVNRPDDKALIREALRESIRASKEGRPGGVLDKLSEKFRIGGEVVGKGPDVARYIRDFKPDVTVRQQDPLVTADEARIVSDVDLKLSLPGNALERTVKNVSIVFRREEAREWLVIPTRKWKLAEVDVPAESVDEMKQSFSGFPF